MGAGGGVVFAEVARGRGCCCSKKLHALVCREEEEEAGCLPLCEEPDANGATGAGGGGGGGRGPEIAAAASSRTRAAELDDGEDDEEGADTPWKGDVEPDELEEEAAAAALGPKALR